MHPDGRRAEHAGHTTIGTRSFTLLLGDRIEVVNKNYNPFPALSDSGDNALLLIAIKKIVNEESNPHKSTPYRKTPVDIDPYDPMFRFAIDVGDLSESAATSPDDLTLIQGATLAVCNTIGIRDATVSVAECSCIVVSGLLQDDDDLNIESPW